IWMQNQEKLERLPNIPQTPLHVMNQIRAGAFQGYQFTPNNPLPQGITKAESGDILYAQNGAIAGAGNTAVWNQNPGPSSSASGGGGGGMGGMMQGMDLFGNIKKGVEAIKEERLERQR